MFMTEFGVSQGASAMLTTVTMIPLAVAPILYGYILESVTAKKLLRISLLVLGVLQLVIAAADSFALILGARVVVGIVLPAIFTSLMTYISKVSSAGEVQRVMAFYISSTIVGGFLGRFISGMVASMFSWRLSFLSLGIAILVCLFLLNKLADEKLNIEKFNFMAVGQVLKNRVFLIVYILVFSMFFLFAALLNFLPYRINELQGSSGVFMIGIMYTGYIMGLTTSLNTLRFIKWIGGEKRTILISLTLYTLSLSVFVSEKIPFLFVGMFLYCGCMFLAHATASGYLNKLAENRKGITNGLYVAFYYTGGALGSVTPGFFYAGHSWNSFLVFVGSVMVVALVIGYIGLAFTSDRA